MPRKIFYKAPRDVPPSCLKNSFEEIQTNLKMLDQVTGPAYFLASNISYLPNPQVQGRMPASVTQSMVANRLQFRNSTNESSKYGSSQCSRGPC